MKGKFVLEAAALYVAVIFALYNRQKITLTKEETKAASFYRAKGAKKLSSEEIKASREAVIQSAEAAKYKLKDKFKEKYLKKTWVR